VRKITPLVVPGRWQQMTMPAQRAGGSQQVEVALGEFGTMREIGEVGKRRLSACGDDARRGGCGKAAQLLQAERTTDPLLPARTRVRWP
jgi:hypothetical protein